MNYFEIFKISVSYKINEEDLRCAYLQKQSCVHPDVNAKMAEESSYLNAAYRALLDPVSRAKHFLEINGIDVNNMDTKSAETVFELREKYEHLTLIEDKKRFQKMLSKKISGLIVELYDLEEDLCEFHRRFCLLFFIDSFLGKIKLNV